MLYLWIGEVSADKQGYRVLATGQKGIMNSLTGIARNFPTVMHLRLYGMNANGKVYAHRPGARTQPVMPLILAVDTSGEHGSLALLRDGELLEEAHMHAPTSFSPVLYAELEGLLSRHRVTLAEVDCFAAASGPGTFTGVRVALACVMGLAEALRTSGGGGVESGSGIALRHGSAARGGAGRAPRRSLRRGLRCRGRAVTGEVVAKLHAWLETLPAGVEEFLSNDLALDLAGTRFAQARVTTAPRALAAAVARIAEQRFLRGEVSDPAELDANYVRRSDAELALKV